MACKGLKSVGSGCLENYQPLHFYHSEKNMGRGIVLWAKQGGRGLLLFMLLYDCVGVCWADGLILLNEETSMNSNSTFLLFFSRWHCSGAFMIDYAKSVCFFSSIMGSKQYWDIL